MGHIVGLVLEWASFGLLVGVPAALIGLVARGIGGREWTMLSILEEALAIGAVIDFVGAGRSHPRTTGR